MYSIRKSVLISILLLVVVSANSQESGGTHTTFGNGGDCAQWVQPRDAANGSSKNFSSIWLSAYLSGINSAGVRLGTPRQTDALKNVSPAQVELWMDNYCRANPLKTISNAAWVLYRELLAQ